MSWLCNVKDNSAHVLEKAQTSVQHRKVRRQRMQTSHPTAALAPAAGSGETVRNQLYFFVYKNIYLCRQLHLQPKASTSPDVLNLKMEGSSVTALAFVCPQCTPRLLFQPSLLSGEGSGAV